VPTYCARPSVLEHKDELQTVFVDECSPLTYTVFRLCIKLSGRKMSQTINYRTKIQSTTGKSLFGAALASFISCHLLLFQSSRKAPILIKYVLNTYFVHCVYFYLVTIVKNSEYC
jgi:hypothetical protein